MSGPRHQQLRDQLDDPLADAAEELEPVFTAELVSAIGIGLIIAGFGAFSAVTVARVWSSLF